VTDKMLEKSRELVEQLPAEGECGSHAARE
jgi:hypothetical protein